MEDQGLNSMDLKTAAGYLEYILNSEGQILWMHFDEAQRIETAGKDEDFDHGFKSGYKAALIKMTDLIETENINMSIDEQ